MRGLLLGPALLGLAMTLSSCSEPKVSAEEQARIDAAKIAAVEKVSVLPPMPISLQTITFADQEEFALSGAGCAFMADDKRGAIALMRVDRGFMKVDDEIVRLVSDSGSSEAPFASRSKYDGKEYSMKIQIDESPSAQSGNQNTGFPARLEVRNGRDQVVFAAGGAAECGY